MKLQTIRCDVPRCEEVYTEEKENAGFPSWGHIQGVVNTETGSEVFHLCPLCKFKILSIITSGKDVLDQLASQIMSTQIKENKNDVG